MIGVISIPTVIFLAINKLNINMPGEKQFIMLLKISPLLLIIFLFISSFISYRIYKIWIFSGRILEGFLVCFMYSFSDMTKTIIIDCV